MTHSCSNKPRIAALLPMRHDSERVPGKNYRPIAGKPLYRHIVESLVQSGVVDRVVIDTDSPIIKQDAAEVFPGVVVLDRPEHLRDGRISMNDVLLNAVRQVDAEYYLQTHSTNPLLCPETIARGVNTFLTQRAQYDSLFSVTALHTRLYDAAGKPMNHDPDVLLRTQDLPPVYEENSCLYLFSRDILERRKNRLGFRPCLFPIPAEEALDIDEELDFAMAEWLLIRRERQINP